MKVCPPYGRLLMSAVLLTAVSGGHAATVTFEVLADTNYANDLSPDGRWVVGNTLSGNQPFRLDLLTGERILLPAPGQSAVAVSDDGSVILGDMDDPKGIGTNVAGIWTEATGWQSLGALPDALGCPSRSDGYELSADGTVATGLSWVGCNGRAFRWTEATGMVEMEPLANGNCRASVISADGSLMGGFAQGSSGRTPAIWATDGTGTLLDPPNGDVLGEVRGISDDGAMLLCGWGDKASIWTTENGIETIGTGSILPGWRGTPMDIADNGVIVGFDVIGTSRKAWIVPEGETDIVGLRNWLIANGAPPPAGIVLHVAQAVSTDGRVIIGHTAFQGGWIVRIEPDCTGDIDGDGAVGFSDLVSLLAAWGSCADCPEDLDGNGDVGFSDLVALLAVWGPCPA